MRGAAGGAGEASALRRGARAPRPQAQGSGCPRAQRAHAHTPRTTTAQAQYQVQRGLLLDVVVAQGAPVLQLLARKDQALLVRRDALLVLDLGLHALNRVAGLHIESDGLARERLDEDLRRGRLARGGGWRGERGRARRNKENRAAGSGSALLKHGAGGRIDAAAVLKKAGLNDEPACPF